MCQIKGYEAGMQGVRVGQQGWAGSENETRLSERAQTMRAPRLWQPRNSAAARGQSRTCSSFMHHTIRSRVCEEGLAKQDFGAVERGGGQRGSPSTAMADETR